MEACFLQLRRVRGRARGWFYLFSWKKSGEAVGFIFVVVVFKLLLV